MDWLERAKKYPPAGWRDLFAELMPELESIHGMLEKDVEGYGRWLPSAEDLFRAFHLTPLNEVKVVLVGSKPSSTENGGRGLAFSADDRESSVIPTPTRAMLAELRDTVMDFQMPEHGDLSEWAMRGVLLLNTSLTSSPGREAVLKSGEPIAAAHTNIWSYVVRRVVETVVASRRNRAVFILLGHDAQRLKGLLSSKTPVIEAPFPSMKSQGKQSFRGSDVFNKTNLLLIENGTAPVDWSIS